MQWQFQQFAEFFVPLVQFLDRMMDIPAACRSWYAQYIPVQQTVEISQVQFLGGCGRSCCFAMTGALVGSCRKLSSFRSCSAFGCRPVPGHGCCARWCNDWGSRNAWFDDGYMLCIIQGGFWKNFVFFYMIG